MSDESAPDLNSVSARLHAEHQKAATLPQRAVAGLVDWLGQPVFALALIGAIAAWMAANLLLPHFGHAPVDPPPFAWLELSVSAIALGLAVLILATQRRDDILARQREQITLELSIISEQKLAKIIALLEESRRDNPLLEDRPDPSAQAMSVPADPKALSDAVRPPEESPAESRARGHG